MFLRSRLSPLVLALALLAAAAHAAAPPLSQLQVVDPVQRALNDKLFAVAGRAELARNLLPGQPDVRLAYYQVFVVPLPNGAVGPILGFPIANNGELPVTSVTLGQTQGTGTTGVAEGAGSLYLAESTSNNIAGYSVDIGTGLLSNAPGAPFPADAEPTSLVLSSNGFLYSLSSSSHTIDIFSRNLASSALTRIGSQTTAVSQPEKINGTRQCVFVAGTAAAGYDAFKINPSTGLLSSVAGSPFGTHMAGAIAHTPDGNFVYFASTSPASMIDGYFADPVTCALTPVPGSPFSGPSDAVLRASPTLDVLYAAGGGELQTFAINPASGALTQVGSPLSIDPDTGAMAVGPKGEHLWIADHSNRNLRAFALDEMTGEPSAVGTPVLGPANVEAMAVEALSGGAQVGQGVAQNRTNRSIGGAPPYTFSITGGALPAGLHMDSTGRITGTANTLGQSSFQVRITDAVGATATDTRVFKVVPAPATPAAPSNATASVDTASQVTVSWQDNTGHTAASRVEMSQDGGPFIGVVTVNKKATSAVVTGLSPATLYKFRVVTTNPGGTSAASNTVTVTTPALGATACTPGDFAQCLLGGRFRVEAIYQDAQGDAGLGHVVPITSDTAYLWFFSSSNVEAVVKMVNGCGLGGHFWVFAGGLTNVHVILRVTDAHTGAVRDYEVPFGQPFTPIQDTAAFGTCGTSVAASTSDDLAAAAMQRQASAEIAARLAAATRQQAPASVSAGTGICTASSTALCLNNSRFRVEATFDAGSAGSGTAHVGSLTSDTGYLWFFSPSNVEAVVKVLNGCSLGGHYWVFAGGLTNVQVTITVTDTLTSAVQHYSNASGTVFQPIQDTAAFASCF